MLGTLTHPSLCIVHGFECLTDVGEGEEIATVCKGEVEGALTGDIVKVGCVRDQGVQGVPEELGSLQG